MKRSNKTRQNLGLLFLIISSTLSSYSQVGSKSSLGNILKNCKKNTSTECKQAFFDNFPNSFSRFQELYGYDEIKGEAPYYNVAEEHLVFLFKTPDIVKSDVFINKLIDISRNGKWDADSVNYFQEKLRNYFFDNYSLFMNQLKRREEKEIKGFWYFFSDGPHFNSEISSKVLKSLKKEVEMRKTYLNIVKKVKKDNLH